jgi:hypothetical protein
VFRTPRAFRSPHALANLAQVVIASTADQRSVVSMMLLRHLEESAPVAVSSCRLFRGSGIDAHLALPAFVQLSSETTVAIKLRTEANGADPFGDCVMW